MQLQPGESVYLSDGAYLTYNGHDWSVKANSHCNPTDTVVLDDAGLMLLVRYVKATRPDLFAD